MKTAFTNRRRKKNTFDGLIQDFRIEKILEIIIKSMWIL